MLPFFFKKKKKKIEIVLKEMVNLLFWWMRFYKYVELLSVFKEIFSIYNSPKIAFC